MSYHFSIQNHFETEVSRTWVIRVNSATKEPINKSPILSRLDSLILAITLPILNVMNTCATLVETGVKGIVYLEFTAVTKVVSCGVYGIANAITNIFLGLYGIYSPEKAYMSSKKVSLILSKLIIKNTSPLLPSNPLSNRVKYGVEGVGCLINMFSQGLVALIRYPVQTNKEQLWNEYRFYPFQIVRLPWHTLKQIVLGQESPRRTIELLTREWESEANQKAAAV